MPAADLLAEAQRWLDEGQAEQAAQLFSAAVQQDRRSRRPGAG